MATKIDICFVSLWGGPVGVVAWDKGQAFFEYEKSFLRSGIELSPIHMPLSQKVYTFPHLEKKVFHGLPGLLASAIPDNFGNKIIDNWFRSQGLSPRNLSPVNRLSYIGTRGMGALEFSPCPSKILDKVVEVEAESLLQLAKAAMDHQGQLNTNFGATDQQRADAMADIIRVGTSAGGAVPKAIVAIDNNGNLRSGQGKAGKGFQHYLLKFDNENEWTSEELGQQVSDTRIEYAYHKMARAAGIKMMDCELLHEKGRAHFLTRRFDRVGDEKVHVLDLSAMAHVGWNPVGSVGYESVFEIMRALNIPYPEHEEQFRRMIFNVLSRNTDDHVKQVSFLMDKDGEWHLSPSYDVTFSYDPEDFLARQHKMTIRGKQENFEVQDFLEVADANEINNPRDIIEEVTDAVSNWPMFAAEAELDAKATKLVGSQHLHDRLDLCLG